MATYNEKYGTEQQGFHSHVKIQWNCEQYTQTEFSDILHVQTWQFITFCAGDRCKTAKVDYAEPHSDKIEYY